MKKIIGIALAGLLIIVIGFIYFQYNKPHRNISSEDASYYVAVDSIFNEFALDESGAYEKYHQKVIVVSGEVNLVDKNDQGLFSVLLQGDMGVANCELDPAENMEFWNDQVGKQVRLKGLFVGYDDLLQELQLKECKNYHEDSL